MTSKLLLTVAAVALLSATSVAAQTGPASSGFPGDYGRLFGGLPLAPDAPKPPRPHFPAFADGPPVELALIAAKAVVAACAGSSVGVSVVDSAGMPKLFYVPDQTAGFHAYTALRKAYTALSYRQPTSAVAALARSDAAVAARIRGDGNLLAFAGGLPIHAQGRLIGAIGVSGAEPSAVDERCAVAGVAAIQAQLDRPR